MNSSEQDERTKKLQEKIRTAILTQQILQEMLQEPCTEEQRWWTKDMLERTKDYEQETQRELAALMH